MGALDNLYNKIVKPVATSTTTGIKTPTSTSSALDKLYQQVVVNPINVIQTKPTQTISGVVQAQPKQTISGVTQTQPQQVVIPAKPVQQPTIIPPKQAPQPTYAPLPNLNLVTPTPTSMTTPETTPSSDLITQIVSGQLSPFAERFGAIKQSIKEKSLTPLVTSWRKQKEQMLPQPGDSPEVIAQKNLNLALGFAGRIKSVEKKPIIPVKAEELIKTVTEKPIETSITKVIQALKEAEPIRGQQEQLYTITRGKKLTKGLATEAKVIAKQGYEAGFKAKVGSLAGELPKVQFESLRKNIGQTDIDNLFKAVKENTTISEWEKLPAGQGLAKIFDGGLPTEGELKLLNQIFPREFIDTVVAKQPLFQNWREAGLQLANIPRTLMASADLSAPLRQGLFLGARNPKEFGKAFGAMFKYFGSEEAFQASSQEIASRPTYALMKKAKLPLTHLDSFLAGREEQFMGAWAEKIPIVGKVVRASARAYTGFLNKLRADVFDKLIRGATSVGRNVQTDETLLEGIGKFIGTFSGRGNIYGWEKTAQALNGVFFSPRLMMSRLTILNPIYYIKADPFVRKEALKSLFSTVGAGMTALGLAKMAGAKVGVDPRSSDFGKIKIGNTRVDIWGGAQQYVRMVAQIWSGKYVSSTTGKEYTLGEGYKPITRWDILQRQAESKLAPIPSFILSLMRQQNYMGQPINIPKEIGSRFTPMLASDIYDIMKDDPSLLPLGIPAAFGVGLQTYTSLPPVKKKSSARSSIRSSTRKSTR